MTQTEERRAKAQYRPGFLTQELGLCVALSKLSPLSINVLKFFMYKIYIEKMLKWVINEDTIMLATIDCAELINFLSANPYLSLEALGEAIKPLFAGCSTEEGYWWNTFRKTKIMAVHSAIAIHDAKATQLIDGVEHIRAFKIGMRAKSYYALLRAIEALEEVAR